MKEDKFVSEVTNMMKKILPTKYIPIQKANLYYQINVDNNLNITVDPTREPRRGQSAFQTDLCIFLKKKDILLPKVVLEFKDSLSTHDVITYSNKAKRHKQIYPYLRYGLISYNTTKISKKFFTHNEGLDFYLTTDKNVKSLKRVIAKLIRQEIKISNILESTIFRDVSYNFYRVKVEFKNYR